MPMTFSLRLNGRSSKYQIQVNILICDTQVQNRYKNTFWIIVIRLEASKINLDVLFVIFNSFLCHMRRLQVLLNLPKISLIYVNLLTKLLTCANVIGLHLKVILPLIKNSICNEDTSKIWTNTIKCI